MKTVAVPAAVTGALALVSAIFNWPFAVGVLIVLASFGLSSLVIAWAASVHPKLVMSAGLGTYILKMIVLFLVFGSFAVSGWDGLRPAAFGVLAGTLTWITTQGIATWRATSYMDRASRH
ncbi:hypothetical protein [Catelliglobosispora koreensis]|uniref:hypothetical protein n=1 Tax=Catelliglobosispora koreensis TaxID=129052 RepID=UPI0003768CDC|nr:hypothetical protein [Catelliglobosispora koreensis]